LGEKLGTKPPREEPKSWGHNPTGERMGRLRGSRGGPRRKTPRGAPPCVKPGKTPLGAGAQFL